MIIEKHWFNRFDCAFLYLHKERAGYITIGYDRSNLRFRHLLFVRVFSLLFVDNGIIIFFQVFVGERYDVFFGQFGHAVDGSNFIFPVCAVDKWVDKHIGTSFVAFHVLQFTELEIVDVRFQHFLVELSGTELLDFAE